MEIITDQAVSAAARPTVRLDHAETEMLRDIMVSLAASTGSEVSMSDAIRTAIRYLHRATMRRRAASS